MPYTAESKRLAKEHVSNLRANTFCCHCGNQPIEYHNEEHEQDSNRRVAHLVALGFPIARINKEIASCRAVCRSCHMLEDGRIKRLQEVKPRQKGKILVKEKPCIRCGTLYKPLRKGLCNKCNHKRRAILKRKAE